MVEPASRTQCLVLAEVLNAYVGKLFRRVFDEVSEDRFVVVSNEDDFTDAWYFGDSSQAVPDDGVSGDVEKRLS